MIYAYGIASDLESHHMLFHRKAKSHHMLSTRKYYIIYFL